MIFIEAAFALMGIIILAGVVLLTVYTSLLKVFKWGLKWLTQ